VPDFQPHRFKFATHLMIPKAQHLDALSGEELVSLFVFRPSVRETMSATIQFHGQPGERTIEVQEVNAARVLAPKLEPGEVAAPEQTPQASLRVGGFLTKLASEVAGGRCAGALFAVLWRSPPHPDPLPRWGRGNFARVVVIAHGHRS